MQKLADAKISRLRQKYASRKAAIESRLEDFSKLRHASDEDLYAEMAFCMLTPQSKARQAAAAIEEIRQKGLLLSDDVDSIRSILAKRIRFHNNKASYVVSNKRIFLKEGSLDVRSVLGSGNAKEVRGWLIENVKGYGWKEASHFLRNVGYGEDIAILDRHILKNLKACGVIKDVPKSLTPAKYLEIEEKMDAFCKSCGIPMSHLDLLFWSEETGEIFK